MIIENKKLHGNSAKIYYQQKTPEYFVLEYINELYLCIRDTTKNSVKYIYLYNGCYVKDKISEILNEFDKLDVNEHIHSKFETLYHNICNLKFYEHYRQNNKKFRIKIYNNLEL